MANPVSDAAGNGEEWQASQASQVSQVSQASHGSLAVNLDMAQNSQVRDP